MIKPTKGNIILKKRKKEKKASGIIIPGAEEESELIVHASADSRVKSGEQVAIREHTGTIVKHDNEEYLIIDADNILAILE